jgi:hypothetical protein
MTIQINWTIDAMEVVPNLLGETNVVITVHYRVIATDYRVIATDENYITSVYGVEKVEEYQEGQPFIPYEEITQEMAVTWVKDSLGTDKVTEIESTVTVNLNALKTPSTTSLSLPWN